MKKSSTFISFVCSRFHEVCAKTPGSGNQPFVMANGTDTSVTASILAGSINIMLIIIKRNNNHYSLCFSHLMVEPERTPRPLLYLRLSVTNAIMAKHKLMNKMRSNDN